MTSNSPETLNLLADALQELLRLHLGRDAFYVLVLADSLGTDAACNCISNVPIERSSELKRIFAELSHRQPQLAQGN